MENATKALLIAGGVLIAIIIIIIIVSLFRNAGNQSRTYKESVQTDEATIFNNNFTKYLGKKFTIHEAITITNFAKSKGVTVNNPKTVGNINNDSSKEEIYSISIDSYDDNGYIKTITIYN